LAYRVRFLIHPAIDKLGFWVQLLIWACHHKGPMHQMFASKGFNLNKLSDKDVLNFANEMLKQMKLISYKYKK